MASWIPLPPPPLKPLPHFREGWVQADQGSRRFAAHYLTAIGGSAPYAYACGIKFQRVGGFEPMPVEDPPHALICERCLAEIRKIRGKWSGFMQGTGGRRVDELEPDPVLAERWRRAWRGQRSIRR